MNVKRKRRPQDKSLDFLHLNSEECSLYNQLLATERKLDSLLVRKRLDIQEALSRPIKYKGILRVFVSNTAVLNGNNPATSNDMDLSLEEPAPAGTPWTLKIEGRLLESKGQGNTGSRGKFSSFLKSMIIELPEDQFEEGKRLIEWKKSSDFEPTDGFEIKRQSVADCAVKIFFQLDYPVEKYELSPELSKILRLRVESKAAVIQALWQYVKANRLQDSNEHSIIHCDAQFKQLFDCESFTFPQLPDLIGKHLLPPEPIKFEYTVSVNQEKSTAPFALDIEVDLEDSTRQQMTKFVTNANAQREIASIEAQMVQNIQKMRLHKLKRDFMAAFHNNPVEFIQQWIHAQSRDLETVLGDVHVNTELLRRAQFYKEPWVAEAIVHYLSNGKRRV